MQNSADNTLSVKGLTKQFGGALALDSVSADFTAGRTHVLFGENGAGKSTLIKTLVGVHLADAGQILFNKEPVSLKNPRDARELGIAVVHQDPSLVEALSVAENITMGQEPQRWGWLSPKDQQTFAQEALDRVGATISPSRLVKDLSRAEQQIIEMARAVSLESKALILDEPTASLTVQETEQLFEIINRLKEQNIIIIYITHRMKEIREIGDDITVLRDGKVVETSEVHRHTDDELIAMMVGRRVEAMFPERTREAGEHVLSISNLTTDLLSNVDLNVRSGEIVGVTGLVGSGKHHLGEACYGLIDYAGHINLDGSELKVENPRQALASGVVYYPSDRKRAGLINALTALENTALSSFTEWSQSGLLSRSKMSDDVLPVLKRLGLKPLSPGASPNAFSGGNQQKIVLARGFVNNYRLHVFDEPTAGVDVGARAEIYAAIDKLAREGAAVLIISSDLPEVINLVDRAYVIAEGAVVGEFAEDTLTESTVLPAFFKSGKSGRADQAPNGKVRPDGH